MSANSISTPYDIDFFRKPTKNRLYNRPTQIFPTAALNDDGPTTSDNEDGNWLCAVGWLLSRFAPSKNRTQLDIARGADRRRSARGVSATV
jgi:hypothetical protein